MWGEKPTSVRRASLFHDGTRIAAILTDKTLRIITLTTGEEVFTPLEDGWEVAVSRDGNLVASVGSEALCLWKAETGEEIKRFQFDIVDTESSHPLAFSPDGTCIGLGCKSDICIFNIDTGEVPSSPFKGHKEDVTSVAYSPDCTQIVSGSSDQTVRVWDASNGSLIKMFDGHTYWNTVCFSPNGTQIAAGTIWGGIVQLWTVETGNSHKFENHGRIFSLAFSQDGRFLIAGCYDDIYFWDLSTTQSNPKLVGYHVDAEVTSVAFFPDGKQIMSTSTDGAIRVWDGQKLEKLYTKVYDVGGYWIFGEKSERLFWTFSDVRDPRNTLIYGPHVDLLHFVHGEEWIYCQKPLVLECKEAV